MKDLYIAEIKKLAAGLIEKGISFTFDVTAGDGCQIVAIDEHGDYLWDAVCNDISLGHESGFLEIQGDIVASYDFDLGIDSDDEVVEGYLTADEILRRL